MKAINLPQIISHIGRASLAFIEAMAYGNGLFMLMIDGERRLDERGGRKAKTCRAGNRREITSTW